MKAKVYGLAILLVIGGAFWLRFGSNMSTANLKSVAVVVGVIALIVFLGMKDDANSRDDVLKAIRSNKGK